MHTIDSLLARFPRRVHSLLPTPIHELPAVSELCARRVFCKRDDLTGFGFGGNKSRKLDFLIGEAVARKCDTLLAVGANQSNFCRMATAYGVTHDMEVHLVLGGRKPARPTGNLRLDHLLGAHCHHVASDSWEAWEEVARALEADLVRRGRKVYRMPIGGSTPLGALGYVAAVSEIMADERRLGLHFDAVVFASSSAGTQAGLVVGRALARWPAAVIGISVAKERVRQEEDVRRLAQGTAALLGVTADAADVRVDDAYLGPGYAAHTAACEEAVQWFARRCGVFLDYVYTGKAAAGLLDYLKRGRIGSDGPMLFLHTGGNVELFA